MPRSAKAPRRMAWRSEGVVCYGAHEELPGDRAAAHRNAEEPLNSVETTARAAHDGPAKLRENHLQDNG